ncbi:MAG: hypothetical protein ACR2PT_10285 [Endozoicomonas sp.]
MITTVFAHAMHYSVIAAKRFPFFRPALHKSNELMVSIAYRSYLKHGEDGWKTFWEPAFFKYGQIRAPYIARYMNIDPQDPKSIGSYHDFEDPVFGVTGHWEKTSDGHPVRVETACLACDHINKITDGKGCPAFCRKVVKALEVGTGTTLNENYIVEIDSLMSGGEATCRFIHKIN